MTQVDLFQANRPRLFAVAYRMLGSASDAEDVVQDAWLRYSAAQPSDVRSPQAYLTTVVTRLCLDRLKSARAPSAKNTWGRGCRSRCSPATGATASPEDDGVYVTSERDSPLS